VTLLECIELAEQAIREHRNQRLHDTLRELQAMEDALRALTLLRRTALRE